MPAKAGIQNQKCKLDASLRWHDSGDALRSTNMSFAITLTDAAANYIKAALAKKDKANNFRLSVKKTGCSGYSYAPTMIEQAKADDIAITTPQGLTIYLDAKYAHLLTGLVIDLHEDMTTGIKQKKLTFINPNEHGRCGCGESFHVE